VRFSGRKASYMVLDNIEPTTGGVRFGGATIFI